MDAVVAVVSVFGVGMMWEWGGLGEDSLVFWS